MVFRWPGLWAWSLAIPAFITRFLHHRRSDSDSVNGRLFSSTAATQRYKVRPYAMCIDGVRFPGAFRLDAGFLHDQTSDSISVNGRMFRSTPATQRCKVCPYAMGIHRVALLSVLSPSWRPQSSMPDSSTTRRPIPTLSTGQCSARRQLHNGIRYVTTRWIFIE